MSNTSVKVAIALFMILTPPAASFARGDTAATRRFGGMEDFRDGWLGQWEMCRSVVLRGARQTLVE